MLLGFVIFDFVKVAVPDTLDTSPATWIVGEIKLVPAPFKTLIEDAGLAPAPNPPSMF
jgi:hypothetical protein